MVLKAIAPSFSFIPSIYNFPVRKKVNVIIYWPRNHNLTGNISP